MARKISQIANIGSGTMGHAIAMQFAAAGYPVTIVETGGSTTDESQQRLDAALKRIRTDAQELANQGLLPNGVTVEDMIARITTATDIPTGVRHADFIIESVVENLDVKQAVWKQIEQAAPQDAIFATNTSGLSPTAIQRVLEHPERFVVAHFWNPAQLMPLVEVVPGESTHEQVVDETFDLMEKIGKKPAKLKRESLGFIGNRIQLAVIREALNIVARGIADPATVDTVVRNSLGLRWSILGPIASADLGGLDIFYNVSKYLCADMDNSPDADPVLGAKVEAGELGAKTGRGFYEWTGEKGRETIAERDQKLMRAMREAREDEEA